MNARIASLLLVFGLLFSGSVPAFAGQDPVVVGTTPNNDKGDPFRNAMIKLNKNDSELYSTLGSVNSSLAAIRGTMPVIDASGKVRFPTGPTLGTYQNGKFTSQPDAIQIQGPGSTGDVSATSVLLPAENIARTLLGRLADIPLSPESFRGGPCASAPNDTCAVQAALDAAAAGQRTLRLAGKTYNVGPLIFNSYTTIEGSGEDKTFLRLISGANATLLAGKDAYSLFGTDTLGGVTAVRISDLTLDGNRAGNPTSGACLALYGWRYKLNNLKITNCRDEGLRSEWHTYGIDPMEATINNVFIDTVGKNGADLRGPHDSHVDNLIIVDAGQNADNTYAQLFLGPKWSGRFTRVHTWHRSAPTNRTRIGLNDSSGGSDFCSSQFEGSRVGPAVFSGVNSSTCNTVNFYSPWDTGSASVIITGRNNNIHGVILGSNYMSGQPARTGIYMGPSAAGNVVNMMVLGSTSGAVDVSAGDAGYNKFTIRGSQTTGPGFSGVFSATSTVDLQMYGATSNGRVLKDASTTAPSTASDSCAVGQRAFDASYIYQCVAPNSWKRSALSAW